MAKRKGKWKSKLKFVIPILIFVLGVGFVVAFEFFIKDKVNSVEVVVAKDDIDFKKEITIDDLGVENVKKDSVVNHGYRPDELDYIVGEFASIDISKGTQIYPALVDSFNLVPDESKGEFIAPLPDEWIFAVAGSLRRAYLADIYVVGGTDQAKLEALIEDEEELNEEDTQEKQGEDAEEALSDKKTEEIIKSNFKPILEDVRISSVKDSGNQEVRESEESPETATGNVSELEIVANNEMLESIEEKTKDGYKLYIVHKFNRSNPDREDDKESEEK